MGGSPKVDNSKMAEATLKSAQIQKESDDATRKLYEEIFNKQQEFLKQDETYNRGLTQQNQANWQPYVNQGQNALAELNKVYTDNNSWLNQSVNYDTLMNTDAYKNRLQQGLNATNNSLAAGSGLLSGAAAKALNNYSQTFASNEMQNEYSRQTNDKANRMNALTTLLNAGMQGTSGYQGASTPTNIGSQLSNLSGNYANQLGALNQNSANTQSNTVMSLAQLAQQEQYANAGGGNMMGGVLGGAASGAATGTAILPGWGTAIGAGVGGLMGAFASRG